MTTRSDYICSFVIKNGARIAGYCKSCGMSLEDKMKLQHSICKNAWLHSIKINNKGEKQ